jgi:hypothetical protein
MHKGKLTNINPPRITTEPIIAAQPIFPVGKLSFKRIA